MKFRHHEIPDNILSERSSKITSEFCKGLMEPYGVQLNMSPSRHPQRDGASEIMNKMVENNVRCYCTYHRNNCDKLLPAAGFAYSSSVQGDLGILPFQLDLVWNPKSQLGFVKISDATVQSVQDLKERLKPSLEDDQLSYKVFKSTTVSRSIREIQEARLSGRIQVLD